ncbi:glycosyltransferase [Paenimyroides tangerinum]|uniref:Glycosyltransferase n=1 Tax=Paenimyroides tangerinum TaxID=2488728 RepID=A0A3P3WFU2_9FLAO|nr:glycosyltransferase [Paenimyroides tangerinum]RRJ93257.1 glycosyltransferase [Paenimyroides tangerinum]
MKQKILFLFHEDTRTGAPNALLAFLNYINENHTNEFIIDVFVLRSTGGEIEPDLKKISRNFYIKRKNKLIKTKLINIFKPISLKLFVLQKFHKYDIIYGNTVLTLKHLSEIKEKIKTVKTILYVHESQYLCNLHLDQKKSIEHFKNIDKILAVAKFTADNLITNYKVSSEKIAIIHPSIKKEEKNQNNPLKGIYSQNDLVLANIGQPSLTKGTELIPQIADALRRRNPNLKFKILIVGVSNENEYIKAIKLDINKLGLENYIELIQHTKTPLNYLEIADAYLITSREDSFTLMGIQAAVFGKPIVTFDKNTGLTEILDKECTYQANYLDITDFVEKIEFMYTNPELSKEKTILAKQKYDTFLDSDICNRKHYLELKKLT